MSTEEALNMVLRDKVRRGMRKLDPTAPDYIEKCARLWQTTRRELGLPPAPRVIEWPERASQRWAVPA
ncbi:hypothetical protein [Streptomyces sp. CCM_MD2014]|uniref:hypothetical protein n=1 Tax=Streptomyces sp. CCM_MD2014 TaxID=1561022 RepID=UPI00052A805A|nr:hypothetical protein [Streptomyces sp. CCM_MD2014]AIV36409.1 hypothetical protein NI25_25460 [Streptomyces sp. CCM_MD2014]